ncbi:MAG: hypothetical protein ABIH46_13030 [Chloroflexota bacterium]
MGRKSTCNGIATCRFCGEKLPYKQMMGHRWDKHRDIMLSDSHEAAKISAGKKRAAALVRESEKVALGKPQEKIQPVDTDPDPVDIEDNGGQPVVPKRRGRPPGKIARTGVVPSDNLADAQIVAISPRRVEMSSTLLWQAREAAIKELRWPADISPEDFLDTWLYESFKSIGIILGGYQTLKPGSNGHKTYTEDEVREAIKEVLQKMARR